MKLLKSEHNMVIKLVTNRNVLNQRIHFINKQRKIRNKTNISRNRPYPISNLMDQNTLKMLWTANYMNRYIPEIYIKKKKWERKVRIKGWPTFVINVLNWYDLISSTISLGMFSNWPLSSEARHNITNNWTFPVDF